MLSKKQNQWNTTLSIKSTQVTSQAGAHKETKFTIRDSFREVPMKGSKKAPVTSVELRYQLLLDLFRRLKKLLIWHHKT